jgi:hypothetical protein
MNACHINPAAWVVLAAAYALVMVNRRVSREPIFEWIDLPVLTLVILLGFSYAANPEELHRKSTIHPLGSLILNYVYSFVVTCP